MLLGDGVLLLLFFATPDLLLFVEIDPEDESDTTLRDAGEDRLLVFLSPRESGLFWVFADGVLAVGDGRLGGEGTLGGGGGGLILFGAGSLRAFTVRFVLGLVGFRVEIRGVDVLVLPVFTESLWVGDGVNPREVVLRAQALEATVLLGGLLLLNLPLLGLLLVLATTAGEVRSTIARFSDPRPIFASLSGLLPPLLFSLWFMVYSNDAVF